MAVPAKRDSAYILKRIEGEHPTIFADYKAGKFGSVNEAARAAGIKKPRTRLQELKNAWAKASASERRSFLLWAKGGPKAPVTAAIPPVTVDRYLESWAKKRIRTIMVARRLSMGDVMVEMGLKALNASLGNALASGHRLKASTIVELEMWLATNAKV